MILHWPQITMLVVMILRVGVFMAYDGQPAKGKYSFLGALTHACLIAMILYYGGFWTGVME